MLVTYLLAVLIIFGVLASWVGVQHWSRRFAEQHPESGSAREEGQGCGWFCGCAKGNSCPRRAEKQNEITEPVERFAADIDSRK